MKEFKVFKTPLFVEWHLKLPPKTRALIDSRLLYLATGHFGDHKRFGINRTTMEKWFKDLLIHLKKFNNRHPQRRK